MAFNGTGTFSRLYTWLSDKTNSIPITASRMDAEFDGIATGLSSCITKDGQTTVTANIPFNSKKITGLGVGNARTDSINISQVQDGQFTYLGTTGGAADAYTLAPAPAITAYTTTMQYCVKIHATNATITPYLQISSIGTPASDAVIKKINASGSEVAVDIGEIIAGKIYQFQRNSSNNAWILLRENEASITNRGISYLFNPIILSNNATTPNTHIDFSTGNFQFSDGSGQGVLNAITKRLDASWTAGNNNGALDTGVKANTTWYHSFVIQDNSTLAFDILFSASATSPTVPSGWTNVYKIKNGQFMTDATANIRVFKKYADGFTKYTVSANGYSTDYFNTPAAQSNTLQAITVPNQSNIVALVKMFVETGTTGADSLSATFDGSLITTTNLTANPYEVDCYGIGDSGRYLAREKLCPTDSAQIKFSIYSSTSARAISFTALGYFDNSKF